MVAAIGDRGDLDALGQIHPDRDLAGLRKASAELPRAVRTPGQDVSAEGESDAVVVAGPDRDDLGALWQPHGDRRVRRLLAAVAEFAVLISTPGVDLAGRGYRHAVVVAGRYRRHHNFIGQVHRDGDSAV